MSAPLSASWPVLTGAAHSALAGGDRIIITGASGWLGMATLELLELALAEDFDDRVVAMGSSARALVMRSGRAVAQRALADLPHLTARPSMLFHFAYLTRDKVGGMTLSDYATSNRRLSEFVENHAAKAGVDRLFLTSSGAAYNADRSLCSDLENNPYGFLKVEDESRFTAWAERHRARAVVARVFNLSGPYINKANTYALSSLTMAALRDEPIIIRARRPVIRSYTSIAQLISVALANLQEAGTEPCIFDTSGDEALEMSELAERVNRALHLALPIEREPLDGSAADRYVGDGERYRALSISSGITIDSIESQIRTTAAYLAPAVSASLGRTASH